MNNRTDLPSAFLCWFCEKNLTDHRYVIQGHFAVCLQCYDEKYSQICANCHEEIGIEIQVRR